MQCELSVATRPGSSRRGWSKAGRTAAAWLCSAWCRAVRCGVYSGRAYRQCGRAKLLRWRTGAAACATPRSREACAQPAPRPPCSPWPAQSKERARRDGRQDTPAFSCGAARAFETDSKQTRTNNKAETNHAQLIPFGLFKCESYATPCTPNRIRYICSQQAPPCLLPRSVCVASTVCSRARSGTPSLPTGGRPAGRAQCR